MADAIVLYPSPGRGHLFSMVELGKLIVKHHPSFAVHIIISTLPNQTISADDSYISSVSSSTPSITFLHLASLPLTAAAASDENIIPSSFFEVCQLSNQNLRGTLLNLCKDSNVKALVIDFFCNAAVQVSSSLNIPTYYFFTSGASGLCLFLYLTTIHRTFKTSLKGQDTIIHIPGVPKISSKDMPELVIDRSQPIYSYFLDTAKNMPKSAGIIVNTFETMENKAVKAMLEGKCTPEEPVVPKIYCIGPIITSGGGGQNNEQECLNWLDSQPSRSVVFLCFGSMGVLSSSQLKEMAIGLERSGVRFLWVVRNPPPDNESSGISSLESLFPKGFLERTKDRGLIVKLWAPQVAVLNHGSVGGFVTHCGWNSILEAVWAGVPMLAWPLYGEQKLNRAFVVEEMKVALALTMSEEEGFVSAMELEKALKDLMESEKGKSVGERVMALRERAVEALGDGGCSTVAFAKLVDSFKQGTSI